MEKIASHMGQLAFRPDIADDRLVDPPAKRNSAVNDQVSTPADFLPAMIYMSGDRRGTTALLNGATCNIVLEGRTGVRIEAPGLTPSSHVVATLRVVDHGCELETEPNHKVWINARLAAGTEQLKSGDVLEIGRNGPMLRYRSYGNGVIPPGSMASVFGDCFDSARFDQGPLLRKTGKLLGNISWEFLHRTTLAFRIGVLAAMLIIAGMVFYLVQQNRVLEARIAQGETNFAKALAESESTAITREDLLALRGEIEGGLSSAIERVGAIESRLGAVARVVSEASQSVIFLQGAYGFEHTETGRQLRHVDVASLDAEAEPPSGNQPVTLGGDGAPVEFQFTGTGFIGTADGLIITNRHVAQPWLGRDFTEIAEAMGLTPVIRRFIGYLPGEENSFDVTPVRVSDRADVAILSCSELSGTVPALRAGVASPKPGDEVIVLGYPTGITAMLARIDPSFLTQLAETEDVNFWSIGDQLADFGYIKPLATRGIIGQVTPSAVVYDAETTSGGSGGPVLNLQGQVVAINAAILREFGGSNLGVPIERATELIEAVESTR